MNRIARIALALIVPSLAAAQLPSPPPEIAAGVVTRDAYPARDISFPNGARGIPGLVYWQPVGFRPLTLDLYLPPVSVRRPAAGFPLVVYIHGGGWMSGDTRRSGPFVDFPGVLASLAARGYVVASIEYRLSGEAAFPAQARDVKAAIRWLRLNASEYGIDPARAAAWGVSAGGHLAGMAAVSCGAVALAPVQKAKAGAPDAKADPVDSAGASDCVQAGIAWYGVFNMSTIRAQAREAKAMPRDNPDAPEWRLLDCFDGECRQGELETASPVVYVDPGDPPMLLIVGTADRTVPCRQTLEMAETLKAAGVKHELIVMPGIDHGFIGKTPEETRDANRKALEATFRFIDRTIGSVPGKNP